MEKWLDKYNTGGWLDKYNDGGAIQENYNDSSVSLPEGFVGMGNDTTGRNYSPAWNGQFQKGGTLPPITVTNPNDPRLKLYQESKKANLDSALLYNSYLDVKQQLKDNDYRVPESRDWSKFISSTNERINNKQFGKALYPSPNYSGNYLIDEVGAAGSDQYYINTNISPQLYNPNIKPRGISMTQGPTSTTNPNSKNIIYNKEKDISNIASDAKPLYDYSNVKPQDYHNIQPVVYQKPQQPKLIGIGPDPITGKKIMMYDNYFPPEKGYPEGRNWKEYVAPERKDYPIRGPLPKAQGKINITSPQQEQMPVPIQQPTNWSFTYPEEYGMNHQQYFNSQAEYDAALKQAGSGQPIGNQNYMGSKQEGNVYSSQFKTKPKLQHGGTSANISSIQTSLDDAEKFRNDWMQSPQYKSMLKTSGNTTTYPDLSVKDVRKYSNKNYTYDIKDIPNIKLDNDDYIENAQVSSDSGINQIMTINKNSINNSDLKYTLQHELSHITDMRGAGIPISDINKISQYAKPTSDFGKYVAIPSETRARLMSIREFSQDNNIYNPMKDKITKEQLDKIKYHGLDDLKTIYSDDQILDLLNSISKTNSHNVPIAKQGGEIPMAQKGYQATTADSLRLYNNVLDLEKFYTPQKGYKKVQSNDIDPKYWESMWDRNKKFFNDTYFQGRHSAYDRDKKQLKDNPEDFAKTYIYAGYSPVQVAQAAKNLMNDDSAYNGNWGKVKDNVWGAINWLAPSNLTNRNIAPQKDISYDSDTDPGVMTELYKYDPLAIKPWNMLTPSEMKERINKYGYNKNSGPTKTKKLVQTITQNYIPQEKKDYPLANPNDYKAQIRGSISSPQQTQIPQPQGDYVYGPSNSVIGVSNNGKFSPINMPDQRGQVNNPDLEMLNNPEALKKYITQKGFKFQMGGNLPGSVGNMYARIGAPSNGKYAKKTLPSAQLGLTKNILGQYVDATGRPPNTSGQAPINLYLPKQKINSGPVFNPYFQRNQEGTEFGASAEFPITNRFNLKAGFNRMNPLEERNSSGINIGAKINFKKGRWLNEFKNGGIIKDDRGQWDHPGEITEIQGNTMATHGYGNIPLYVVPDMGQPRIVQPNTGTQKFKGARKFTEYPIAKNGLRQEQKGLQNLDDLVNFTNYNKPTTKKGWLDKYQ